MFDSDLGSQLLQQLRGSVGKARGGPFLRNPQESHLFKQMFAFSPPLCYHNYEHLCAGAFALRFHHSTDLGGLPYG